MSNHGRRGTTSVHGSRQDWLTAAVVLLLAAGLIAPAWALEGEGIGLLGADDPAHAADAPFIFELGRAFIDGSAGQLVFRMNGLDVTDFVTIEDGTGTLAFAAPLEAGSYTIDVLAKTGEAIREVASWSVYVTSSDTGAAHPSDALRLTYSVRLADHVAERAMPTGNPDPIGTGIAQGIAASAAGLTSAATGDHWGADGPQTRLQRAVGAEEAADPLPDLGAIRLDTSFVGDGFGAGLAFGEQRMVRPSLIADETERRGLSGRIALDALEAELTAFSVNPVPIVSTETEGDAAAPALTLHGFDLAFTPLPAHAPGMRVRMGFNRGASSWTADGGAERSSESGAAGMLGLEASLFEDRLSVLAEASRTEFDADGVNGAIAPLRSDGYRVTFEATPYASHDPEGLAVRVTGAYERLGTFFRALTNPGLAGDVDTIRLGTSLVWPRFSVDAVASHLTNNVDDLGERPRDRWLDGRLGLTYRPDVAAAADGAVPWYGRPDLFATVSATDVDRLAEADGGPSGNANSRSYAVEAGVSLDPGWGSLGLSQGYRALTARGDAASDADTYITTASVTASLSPRLTVRSDVRYEHTEVPEDGLDRSTVNLTLGTDAELIPGRLTLNLDYLAALQFADAVAPETQGVSADLFVKLLRARGGRPGIGVSLNGNLDTIRGHLDPATGFNAGPETRASLFARLKLWTGLREASQ